MVPQICSCRTYSIPVSTMDTQEGGLEKLVEFLLTLDAKAAAQEGLMFAH